MTILDASKGKPPYDNVAYSGVSEHERKRS